MHVFLLTIATAVLGVDVGWTPSEGGKQEFIIQIEAEQLDTLRAGKDLFSEVPPGLNISRYRITVGKDPLPHDSGTPAAAPASSSPSGGTGDIAGEPSPTGQRAPAAAESSTAAADAWPPIPAAKAAAEPKARDAQPSEFPRRGDLPFSFGSTEPKASGITEPKASGIAEPKASGFAEPKSSGFAEPKSGERPFDSRPANETPFSAAGSTPAAETTAPQDRSPLGSSSAAAADEKPGLGEREPPRAFSDNQVQPAVAHKPESPSGVLPAAGTGSGGAAPDAAAPAKPWMAFVLTLFALCVSLGGNAYMGWVTWIARMRYRSLVDDLRGTAASST